MNIRTSPLCSIGNRMSPSVPAYWRYCMPCCDASRSSAAFRRLMPVRVRIVHQAIPPPTTRNATRPSTYCASRLTAIQYPCARRRPPATSVSGGVRDHHAHEGEPGRGRRRPEEEAERVRERPVVHDRMHDGGGGLRAGGGAARLRHHVGQVVAAPVGEVPAELEQTAGPGDVAVVVELHPRDLRALRQRDRGDIGTPAVVLQDAGI